MNESLRRALIRAQLREEDVAERLEVDPKTVRRRPWISMVWGILKRTTMGAVV